MLTYCFSNKTINLTALEGLSYLSILSPCFSLLIWACNISMIACREPQLCLHEAPVCIPDPTSEENIWPWF